MKQKQPYIPFYIGDWLKDTRILPLNARGAWIDLIMYMWDNEPKGEIIGTHEEFARLLSCSVEEVKSCFILLNQKKTFACEQLDSGRIKIISRKIRKMVLISERRQNAGKRGGNPNLVKQQVNKEVNQQLNLEVNQIPEYEYEYKDRDSNTSNTFSNTGGLGENLKYEDFKKSLLEQQVWCEEVCMKTQSKLEELPKMIDNFISHCIMGGQDHYTEKEFKTHFRNVCLSKIDIVKPTVISSEKTDEKVEKFRNEVLLYKTQYDGATLEAFFNHWSQVDQATGLLKWEKETAFEISKRLISWKENGKNFKKNGNSKEDREAGIRNALEKRLGQ